MSYFLMSRQLRPLKRLAIIAETFGRGLDAPDIKTAGAYEIRQTANAFNQMRTRIKRFLKQRTEMLAGVSHDLRTPLTRMKLQISLMKDEKAKSELEADVNEMTSMLDSYVSFVKTESPEPIETIVINELIADIIKTVDKNNIDLVLNEKTIIQSSVRQIQLKRAFNNIIDNSQRYAKKIEINLYKKEKDCKTEYLDAIISVKCVKNVHEVINHILQYGTMHTDSIVTNNKRTAEYFLKGINSAIAMHNASTQFADGGEFGFGGEIGISTNKMPPRGPVGINQLTSYKYIVEGKGSIRP